MTDSNKNQIDYKSLKQKKIRYIKIGMCFSIYAIPQSLYLITSYFTGLESFGIFIDAIFFLIITIVGIFLIISIFRNPKCVYCNRTTKFSSKIRNNFIGSHFYCKNCNLSFGDNDLESDN